MDAPPRTWVLKPLSPRLQLSDLRTVSAGPTQIRSSLDHQGFSEASRGSSEVASSRDPGSPELLFQARHVTFFQDGAPSSGEDPPSNPSSPSGSSSSSQCGFYSFVEDPRSPEAQLNQAWMVSPQRHAQLATLKMEGGFKLQTYIGSRKPQSLFSENGEDQQYQGDPYDGVAAATAAEEEDEKLLRKEIIRHQAPRGAPRLMDSGRPRSQQLNPAAPSSINKDSINFTAARQQFLRLEQERASALLKPVSFPKAHLKAPPRPEENRHQSTSQREELQHSSGAHVLDSGLDGLSSSAEAAWSSFSRRPPTGGNAGEEQETPIEREIRLVQQREENLRLSRGLKISTAEIVEIRTRRLHSPLFPSKAKDLEQKVQTMQRKDKHQPKAAVQEEHPLDPGESERKADQERREERPLSADATDFPSPCCPHRHPEETESAIWPRTSDTASLPEDQDPPGSPPGWVASPSDMTMDTPRSWRENLQLNGLQSRNSGAPDFIEKEIEEALKREEELRELRAPRGDFSTQALSPAKEGPRTPDSQVQPRTHTGTHFRPDSSTAQGAAEVCTVSIRLASANL